MRRPIVFIALAFTVACARPQPRGPVRPIDQLRQKAADHPADAALWRELAIAEHLADGGEAERAKQALTHALKLSQSDIRLELLRAEAHVLEGRPDRALGAYLRLLSLSPKSADPLAPALAELALSATSDMNDAVDDYRPRVIKALEQARAQGQSLGLAAAHQARMQLMHYRALSGDVEQAAKLSREAGCIESVRAAGPFGPRALLGFDHEYPAEKPGPLKDDYDLGPGRHAAHTRTIATRRCLLALGRGAHDPLPGSTIVRGEIEIERAGAHALRVESPNSFVLWVDGKRQARVDLRTSAPGGARYLPLQLSAGRHELKLKISSRHPNPALSLALVPAEKTAIDESRLPDQDDLLTRFVAAKLALARGNTVRAREIARTQRAQHKTAHWLVLEASARLSDPLRASEQRRDAARDLLRKTARENPDAWYPSMGLASLDAAEGRTKEAIEQLRAAQGRFPQAVAIQTALIQLLRQNGYVEEADQRLEALRKRMPHACALIEMALSAERDRGRMPAVEALTEATMACNATSTARLTLLKNQRKYEEAASELTRLRELSEPMDEAALLESELELARLRKDRKREQELRKQRSALWPDRPEPVIDLVDQMLTAGSRSEALRQLDQAISEHPDTLFELTSLHEALGGTPFFAGLKKDGDAVIAAYKERDVSYEEPQVLVLDYTVVRIFKDGSSADLTHNIMHLQSQEAVDQNGEFSPPEGARLLQLHTVKSDGRKLEPDPISGKETWSLPNLAPGDFVEFEHVRSSGPPAGFPGGYLGDRFYFKSFEIPFDHTELVVVLDPGVKPVLDPRGKAPKPDESVVDGLTVLRFRKRESRPLKPEPGSVAAREFIPSINLGIEVSWESYVESLREMLVDKDVVDPEARAFVHRLLEPLEDAPISTRAEKLYRFVIDEIEPTEDVFGLSAAMLAARTGSRERVLRYMLGLAGITSELALVRGAEADHLDGALPDPDTYGHLAVRIQTEKGPVWAHTGARHTPFGYLPPHLRGEKALLLNAKAEQADTPRVDLTSELRSSHLDVALAEDGSAKIKVRQEHRGTSAIAWRNDLDAIPPAELETRFEEGYASQLVPGARLVSLKIENAAELSAPLIIRFELAVDALGHRVGEQLRVPGLLENELQAQYARQKERTTTALIGAPQASDVHIRLAAPKGASVAAIPESESYTFAKSANFTLQSGARDGVIEVVRSLRLPSMRVKPTDYAGLAEFCRAVDLAESREIAVKLP